MIGPRYIASENLRFEVTALFFKMACNVIYYNSFNDDVLKTNLTPLGHSISLSVKRPHIIMFSIKNVNKYLLDMLLK